jgi:DNA-binding SARP family transcriptional activator
MTVRVLGTLQVACGGILLEIQQQKARALLFYLAVTGRAHGRDHLATLLWGESDASSARHSLRSTLYNLRGGLRRAGASEVLRLDGGLVGLNVRALACDVLTYRALLAEGTEGALAQAVSLYGGPLLHGFSLAEAPDFERWERDAAAELRALQRDALARLAEAARSRKASGEVARLLQQLVALDPLDEGAQRQLMRFYIEAGSLAKALQQFEALEAALRQELGVSPEPETAALIRDALLPRRPSPTPPPDGAYERVPLRGREDASWGLRTLANDAASGRGASVLVEGDDGIGKTRLVADLAEELGSTAEWRVLRGTCSPFDDTLALGPFFEAFQLEAAESGGPGGLGELFADAGTQLGDLPGGLFVRVLKAIRLLSRSGPILLVLEDLQWASSATLRLFGFLAVRLRDLPVLLIGTVLRAESIPALARLLALGRRRGEVSLVTLGPLNDGDVLEILRSSRILSPSLYSLAAWLHERSGGNPYILLELLAQLRTEGILARKADEWHLDSGRWLRWRATAALPETTHDLVAGRLAGLSLEARHLLDVLAVAAEALPYDLLQALPDGPRERTLDVVEELRARQLVLECADECFDLPHQLVREALLRRLGRLRRRTIHRQLALTIEGCPPLLRRSSSRQVARHAVAGGDVERARRYGMQVVAELHLDPATPAGVDFLRDLADLLASTATSAEQFRLARALGRAYRDIGTLDEARRWFGQALEAAAQAGDTVAQVDACFEQAELALVANDYHAAVTAAEMGLSVRGAGPGAKRWFAGRGHWLIGAALAMNGTDLVHAERHLKQALRVYTREADSAGQCLAHFELGNVAAQHGHLRRALESYAAAARAAEVAGNQYFLALAHNNRAYHSLLTGDAAAARAAAEDGRRVAERASIPAALLHLCSTEGEIALYAGAWDAASEAFQSGLALAEELGSLERQAGYRAGLALVARGQDDLEGATALLLEALALLEGRGYWHLQARVRLWLADTLLARERSEEARIVLDAALDVARTQRRDLLRLQGERLRAQVLAATGTWAEADAHFARTVEESRHRFPLEALRTRAAWGVCVLRHAPPSEHSAAAALLRDICAQLATCGACAEAAAIERALAAGATHPTLADRASPRVGLR